MSDTPLPSDRPELRLDDLRLLPRPLAFLEERLNPLLVKELRQFLRGKAFAWCFFWVVFLSVIGTSVWVIDAVTLSSRPDGNGVLMFQRGLLTLAANLIVPLIAFQSMTNEHRGAGRELLALTGLSPLRMVFGKWQAAMVLMVLFLFAIAPFLSLAFLMKGVGLTTVLREMILPLTQAASLAALAVLLGAGARTQATRVVLMGLLLVVGVFPSASFLAMSVSAGSMGGFWGDQSLAEFVLTWSVQALSAGVLAIALCACGGALLAFPVEDRSTAPRLGVVCALITSVVASWVPYMGGRFSLDPQGLMVSLLLQLILFFVLLAFGVTETNNEAVFRGALPRRRGLRTLAAPFLPGNQRAFLWGFLVLAVVFLGFVLLEASSSHRVMGAWVALALVVGTWVFLPAAVLRIVRPVPSHATRERVLLLVLPLLTTLVPPIASLLIGGGGGDLGHGLNPVAVLFLGAEDLGEVPGYELTVLLAIAGFVLGGLQALGGLRGVLAAEPAKKS